MTYRTAHRLRTPLRLANGRSLTGGGTTYCGPIEVDKRRHEANKEYGVGGRMMWTANSWRRRRNGQAKSIITCCLPGHCS